MCAEQLSTSQLNPNLVHVLITEVILTTQKDTWLIARRLHSSFLIHLKRKPITALRSREGSPQERLRVLITSLASNFACLRVSQARNVIHARMAAVMANASDRVIPAGVVILGLFASTVSKRAPAGM